MVPRECVLENKDLIPFFGVDRQYQALRKEILDLTDQVYASGQVLDGEYTRQFEAAIARRCNRKFAVAVTSATQGLTFALSRMLTKSKKTKILLPAISYVATLNAAKNNRLDIEFCDVDVNGLMDIKSFGQINDIDAVLYANLWGHTIDYDEFVLCTDFFTNGSNNIFVVEDAAQSFGASYRGTPSGKLGAVSVLSFDPTKNLNNYGSGGMVLTDDAVMYSELMALRNNGKYLDHSLSGTNSRMSETDCAQMLVKLKYFDKWQQRRREIAEFYIANLAGYVDVCLPGKDVASAWSKFVIKVDNRSQMINHLHSEGVSTKVHYSQTLLDIDQKINQSYSDRDTWCADEFSRASLSLPIYPELTDSEVEHIAASVVNFYR